MLNLRHLLIALCGSLPLLASAGATLNATVTTESRWITADGIEKQTRFTERLVRSADQVWTERILPRGTPKADPHGGEEHEAGGHLHPSDLAGAAKLVSRSGQNVALSFYRVDQQTRVDLAPRDFDSVGFDGRWDGAWSLIDPAVLKRLKRSARSSTEAGAQWYEHEAQGEYLRVLWSQPLKLALRIESGRSDGSRHAVTSVNLEPATSAPNPWLAMAGFTRRDYTDLLD